MYYFNNAHCSNHNVERNARIIMQYGVTNDDRMCRVGFPVITKIVEF